jgi:Secretion system C-terminal sorting domain
MKKFFTLLSVPILLFLSSFIPSFAIAQPVSQTFDASGTYIVPAGYTVSVVVQAWGGGGGGGVNTNGAKGGGAGGSYASSTLTLSPGSYVVTVGAGGAPGVNGGSSGFTSLVIAQGGGAANDGVGGAAGSSVSSTGTIVIESSAGLSKENNDGGSGGNAAYSGGAGGAGGIANNGSGSSGIAPGGGGGGKAGPGGGGVSGSGANGRVTVTLNTVLASGFSNIVAYDYLQGIQIDWTVNSEANIDQYQVERSANGTQFTAIGKVTARNASSPANYNFYDVAPLAGINYYRVRSRGVDGRSTYSTIIRINRDKSSGEFTIYPNPVQNGIVAIQSAGLAKGRYYLKILNMAGPAVYSSEFVHNGGAINQTIQLPAGIKAGIYTIQLTGDGASRIISKLVVVQ